MYLAPVVLGNVGMRMLSKELTGLSLLEHPFAYLVRVASLVASETRTLDVAVC